jgi:Asp-tRNA(Asn)/Glu-tRNA(Gln) amidotransferase A subunit family amidase
MYLSGELTPLAVAESLIPLIRRDGRSPSRHSIAFIDCHPDDVLEAAKASTLRYQNGSPLSIIDGVPTAIKDEVDLAGFRTTTGRKMNERAFEIAKETPWTIRKWEEAGVIILGKSTLHELGADTTNNNPNWGTPRNPHNSQYYPGGSSGGSAYAVSAGLVPFAFGNDGGGSIRIPASFCGIYGLKPSHNRLDNSGSTVTVSGPLAANMSDLEIAYRIMATPNAHDPISSLFTPPGTVSPTRPKILGICRAWFDRADPAVLKICNDAVQSYESLGYKVIPIEIPYLPEGQIAHAFTILCGMAVRARARPVSESSWLADLNPANKILLSVGDQTPARDYLLAQQLRNLLMQHLAFLYRKYPGLLILTPTTPVPGWPIASEGDLKYGFFDGNHSIRNMEYVWLANFSGCPAIGCPVGYVDPVKGKGKIPVGLMAMGEWGNEDALIEWGKDAEKWLNEGYTGGRLRPGNWEDIFILAKERLSGDEGK